MKCKNLIVIVSITIALLSFTLLIGREVQAGSKDLTATKRVKYLDDNVESMRDVFARQEEVEKEYRDEMLSNSNQSIKLLTEIRDLLKQLNEKE